MSSNPIGSKSTTQPSQPLQKAAAPAPQAIEPAIQPPQDSFLSTPPTPAQLAGLRAAVAALDALPPMPKDQKALRAWAEQARPVADAADKAAHGMGSAAFFHKSLPKAEADAANTKTWDFQNKLRDAEERVGLREPVKPLDPNRAPLGATKAVGGMMSKDKTGIGALFGLFALPFTFLMDASDKASRKQEAKDYPAAMAEYERRKAIYDAEQAKNAPAAKP